MDVTLWASYANCKFPCCERNETILFLSKLFPSLSEKVKSDSSLRQRFYPSTATNIHEAFYIRDQDCAASLPKAKFSPLYAAISLIDFNILSTKDEALNLYHV